MDALFYRLPIFAILLGLAAVSESHAQDQPVAPSGLIVKPTPSLVPDKATPEIKQVSVAGQAVDMQTQVKVVATVAGESIITEDEIVMMLRERAYDFVNLQGEERTKKEAQVYQEELRKLIDRELILHDFLTRIKKNKPAAVDEVWEQAKQSADRQIRDFRKIAGMQSEEAFTQYIRARGTDAKMFRRFFERTALMSIFLNSLLKETGRGVALTQIQEYYRNNPKDFRIDDKVKWQHLFVSSARFNTPEDTKLYADWLRKSLEVSTDVPALAKQWGHGDSALRGGEGIGDKPGEIRPEEVEPTLMKLKPGQVSELIPTANGYHIVKVLEREYAGVKPLDDKMQQAIRNRLTDQLMKQERDRIVVDLWRKYTVVVAK